MRTILRRALQLPLGLLAAATLAFLLLGAAPGSPVTAVAGEHATAETRAEVEASLGLDRPMAERYARFLGGLARGDLGQSWLERRPVLDVILDRLPVTLALTLPAAALSLLGGLLIGLWTTPPPAARHGVAPTVFMLLLHSVPAYCVAAALVAVFSLGAEWLPVQGLDDPRLDAPTPADRARHLVLPVLTLALHHAALTALTFRAALHAEVHKPYATAALSRGASFAAIRRRHAAPNALAPVLGLMGGRIGGMLAGAVLVETAFALPGLGRLAVSSAINRDQPVVVGIAMLGLLAVMLGTLVADLAQARLDPRARR